MEGRLYVRRWRRSLSRRTGLSEVSSQGNASKAEVFRQAYNEIPPPFPFVAKPAAKIVKSQSLVKRESCAPQISNDIEDDSSVIHAPRRRSLGLQPVKSRPSLSLPTVAVKTRPTVTDPQPEVETFTLNSTDVNNRLLAEELVSHILLRIG